MFQEEEVTDCCLMPTGQILSYIMARTRYILMSLCRLCSRSTHLFGFL